MSFIGKTESGFEYDIPKSNLDDMEFVDALSEIENDNPLAISKAIELLLGTKQKKRLYDHVRNEHGKVPIEQLTKVFFEIFKNLGKEGKN